MEIVLEPFRAAPHPVREVLVLSTTLKGCVVATWLSHFERPVIHLCRLLIATGNRWMVLLQSHQHLMLQYRLWSRSWAGSIVHIREQQWPTTAAAH